MFQDTYTLTEKFCSWDRADRRSNVHTRRRRTPQREVHSSHDNTTFETDIPVGEGFGYPPQIFIDPEFVVTVPHTVEEEEVSNNVEGSRNKFIGNYCEMYDQCGETRCWYNSSDWGEELLDVETPNANPTLENKTPSPTVRKPPAGWVEHRRRTVKAMQENKRNIIIENSKSILQEEFNNNNSM